MQKDEKDIFEINNATPVASDNFFLSSEHISDVFHNQNITEPTRRLNDYDSNLLQEDAYKDVEDDLFKLEYKISRIEEELRTINSQIESAGEIQDYNLIEELQDRRKILEEDYQSLVSVYNEKSISAKISDKILGLLGHKLRAGFSFVQKKASGITDVIVSKMPKQVASAIELKKSLSKLENLNKSVDELIGLNIPYGENYNKYEQLSKYIIKANSIQAEISKYMNK